jgi:hypothetical protein
LDHNGRVIFDPVLSMDNPLCDPAPLIKHEPVKKSLAERTEAFNAYYDKISPQ